MDSSEFEDSDDDLPTGFRSRRHRASSVASTSTVFAATTADDDYCEIIEEDAEPDILFATEVIDLTKDDSERLVRNHRPEETELDWVETPNGIVVKPGNFVQVGKTKLGDLKINFTQVNSIIQDRSGRTFIRGIPYTRLRHLKGKIRDRLNEVCMVLHIHMHSDRRSDTPVLIDIELDNVIRWRTFITTNARYPAHSVDISRYARPYRSLEQQSLVTEISGTIVCRWSISIIYSIDGRNRTKAEQELIEHLRSEDVQDPRYRVSDNGNSEAWRGPRKRGGACKSDYESEDPLHIPISRCPGQLYTLFDSFSGAGGVSRGAQDAGFKVRYAIDKEPEV